MWFYIVTTMILVLMGIGIFLLIWEHRKRIAQRFKRVNYSELLRVLENLTAKANNMAALVEHIKDKKVIQLADSVNKNVKLINKNNGKVALTQNDENYVRASSWNARWVKDYYVVNIESGSNILTRDITFSR